jgi:hypothetical protein
MRVPATRCLNADINEQDQNVPVFGFQKTSPAAETFASQGPCYLKIHCLRSLSLIYKSLHPEKRTISFESYIS